MSVLTPDLFRELQAYIDARLIPEEAPEADEICFALSLPNEAKKRRFSDAAKKGRRIRADREEASLMGAAAAPRASTSAASLEEALSQLDESFSEMLLRKIDEAGITDAACYKKARVDRKLFSKIRSNRLYRPTKPTALAFVLALELPLPEAREMLSKAGFSLSRSSRFDVIVEFFLSKGIYDPDQINEALYRYDQPLIGA